MQKRKIGNTKIEVDALGVGGAPLSGNYTELDRETAAGVIDTALAAGITYVDTAPFYGFGRSERVVGDMVRGKDYILSTKVGRLLKPGPVASPADHGMNDPLPFTPFYDYSYDGIMRSFEDSLQRLGLDRIDILLAHDIGEMQHGEADNSHHMADLEGSGYRALDELRSAGDVSAIGLGVNEKEVCLRVMEFGQWDAFLLAGRYTLLEQTPMDDLLPACEKAGTSIITGGPFNSGVLVGREMWNYAKAPDDIVEKVGKLKAVCDAHTVEMPAAALQFPLAHPAVASVIPGARSAEEFTGILNWAKADIPAAFWSDLQSQGLIHPDAPLPTENPFI